MRIINISICYKELFIIINTILTIVYYIIMIQLIMIHIIVYESPLVFVVNPHSSYTCTVYTVYTCTHLFIAHTSHIN